MTNENLETEQSRRKFIKKSAAVGTVATTGVAAFGGSAAAQQSIDIDASNLINVSGNTVTITDGLINVTVNDVTITDVLDVTIKNVDVTVGDVTLLSNNNIDVDIVDDITVTKNTVVVQVAVLGENAAGKTRKLVATDVLKV